MKIAIMQPYFFPYPGYFSLIKNTDKFILLDEVQFIRHGWIERNRILKQKEGWIYIKVPLIKEEGRSTKIKNVKINNTQTWKQKIIAQLQIYKKIAPNYNKVMDLVNDIFKKEYFDIVSLNKVALETVCDYIGVPHNIDIFSRMDIVIDKPEAADEWALNICKALGNINEYLNPHGGINFFDKVKYEKQGIALKFLKFKCVPYDQKRPYFEPDLSIIDVMMFNSKEFIFDLLDNYEIL